MGRDVRPSDEFVVLCESSLRQTCGLAPMHPYPDLLGEPVDGDFWVWAASKGI
jgi:hypothetical protein